MSATAARTPGERAAEEATLVELVATWSAGAQSDLAPLLEAIASVPRGPDLLRALHQRSRDRLPADLRDEIDQAITIMGAGGSLDAPSFRARLDRLLARARDVLQQQVLERGASVATHLKSSALLLDGDELGTALRTLWRCESPAGIADLLALHDDLERTRTALEAGRGALAEEIESRRAARTTATGAGADLERARVALESGDPLDLYRARLVIQGLDAGDKQRALANGRAEARARLADLCARARQRCESPGGGAGAQLLAEAVAQVEQLVEAGAVDAADPEVFEPALAAWERSLSVLLGADRAAADATRRKRQSLAQSFQSGVERLIPQQGAAGDAAESEIGRQAAALARTLGELADSGGRPFQEAIERAGALLQGARSQVDVDLKAAGERLQSAARDLASFLETTAEQLPTARVVEARLRLEQVAGIVAMQRLTSIEDSEQALRQDIEELRRLATQAQRRRSSREEAERDAIRSEADSLAAVARPRLARRVEGLAAAAEQADENELADLRERLDGLRVRVERAVRLRAAKAHHAGRRWVRKAGQRAAAKRPGPAQEVNQSLEALAAALQKDDLAALRDRASGARAALRKVALTARPWFRVALAGAAVLVLAASFLAWRQAGHRPQTYSLKLDAQPREPVSIWLVRDGEIVGRRQYSGGNDGVSFDLDPGRYEVFVNERYTGRVVSVPGQREVTGIPLPVPYQ